MGTAHDCVPNHYQQIEVLENRSELLRPRFQVFFWWSVAPCGAGPGSRLVASRHPAVVGGLETSLVL